MKAKKMKVYYAHCMAIYDTPQEERDVKMLADLGFSVLNPNQVKHQRACKRAEYKMRYFIELANGCDVLAFRANPDGSIPSGVAAELTAFSGLIIELPSCIKRRTLSFEETIAWLKESGER